MNPTQSGREPGPAGLRARPSGVHQTILDSMTSGVMSLDASGVIRTFNPAAVSILALERDDDVGATFAQLFVPLEGLDEFNEVVLDSVYGEQETLERRVVVETAGRTRALSLTTSHLTGAERGVVAVFSDVSETEALQAKEQTLAKQVARQNKDLQSAYQTLETRNRDLANALRKVQIIRTATTAALGVLFIGVVLHGLGVSIDLFKAQGGAPAQTATQRTHTVKSGRIESIISVPGIVAPLVEIPIRSPLEGTLAAVHVEAGQVVSAGDRLLDLDTSEVGVARRNADVAYLKSLARERDFARWDESAEVARARRAVTKAQLAFDSGRSQVEQTAFLYEAGLIARTKKIGIEREQRSRELDLESAQIDLEAIIARGEEDHAVAVLERRNAQAEKERLEKLIEGSSVIAPVGGVILGSAGRPLALTAGTTVTSRQHLLTISEGRSLAVRGRIDEIRVHEIGIGDRVRVTGAAFPGVTLDAKIEQVSAHALQSASKGLPSFAVVAAIEGLTDEQTQAIRLGMSATMDVVVYERDDAVLVPIGAVDPRARTMERIEPGSGERRTVAVKTGRTTASAVEIVEGVEAGDVVVVP